MKRLIFAVLSVLLVLPPAAAQADRRDVRAGNRKFRKEGWKQSEIDYRKALVKDSLSVAASYDLASSLYRQEDYDGAGKSLERIKETAPAGAHASDYYYNLGDVALQKKDYAAAVDAFRQSLLVNPGDIDAKENYIYAKLMLQNQQNGGGGGSDNQQDQDQNNQDQNNQDQNNQDQQNNQNQQNQDNQDQDNKDDQNQDNRQNQDNQDRQDRNDQGQGSEPQISQQQAQQMLQAIQAKEKETQDKVNKEKALLLQSRQK